MMPEDWRDPDLPDGIVPFPPAPRPPGGGSRRLVVIGAVCGLVLGWLIATGRLP